jgi:hypothetical protein
MIRLLDDWPNGADGVNTAFIRLKGKLMATTGAFLLNRDPVSAIR